MNNPVLKLIFSVLVMASGVQAFASTTVSLSPFVRGDGELAGTGVYLAYGFETKADYKVSLETKFRAEKEDGDDSWNYPHYYLRSTVVSPYSVQLDDAWKIGWSYRYVAPTSAGDQAAGSYGALGFRPWITGNVAGGMLELLYRPAFYVHLQREGFETNPPGAEAGNSSAKQVLPQGNRLIGINQEFIPTFKIYKGLWFTPYVAITFNYHMEPPNGTSVWKNTLYLTPELGYTFEETLGGFDLSVYYDDSSSFGENADFDLFKDTTYEFGLALTKTF